MSDPSKLSRDVKGLVADFRDELKLRDPWDREIDIQFKRIQRRYKELLFEFPFARQAQSVDQALWTDTSYALITRYRARIDPARSTASANKNVVENRKILQKFLAFLAAEGSFWSGIALRLVRAHGLTEANEAMKALGMDVVEFENRDSLARRAPGPGPGPRGRGEGASTPLEAGPVPPTHPPPTPEHRSNKLLTLFRTLIFLGDLARYREQYGTHPNKSNAEGGRRPRGGRRGKDKGGEGVQEKRYAKAEAFYLQARLLLPDYGNPFNQLAIVYSYQHDLFGAALNYYRALCVRWPFPTAKDNLIRTLGKSLEADRDLWRARRAKEAGEGSGAVAEDGGKGKGKSQAKGKNEAEEDGPGDLEGKFKQDVVLLHALWTGKCRKPKLIVHTHNVLASFGSLAARRLLPAATLVQVLVLSLGALWKVRMFRDGDSRKGKDRAPKDRGRGERGGKEKEDADLSTEACIVAHILALCTVLLEIGTREIQEGIREAGDTSMDVDMDGGAVIPSEKLAQRITGTFRRMLPALRIATKWIKANVEYMQRQGSSHPQPASNGPQGSSLPHQSDPTRPDLASFWLAWTHFANQVAVAFPLDSLPPMTVKLEEDIDMKGFAPLKRGMSKEGGKNEVEGAQTEVDAASVHPNEEQLMRIGDLIVDAKYIVSVTGCPVSLVGAEFVLDMQLVNPDQGQNTSSDDVYTKEEGGEFGLEEDYEEDGEEEQEEGGDDEEDNELEHPDDDRATVSTRTEDDPVRLAMDAVLTEDEDEEEDEEEEILYPQTGRTFDSTMPPPPIPISPSSGPGLGPVWPPPTPSFLLDSSSASGPDSSSQAQPTSLSRSSGTTAQDLLNRVMSGTTGPATPTFLNNQTISRGSTSSFIGPATSFGGHTVPIRGPTPSFLGQSGSVSPHSASGPNPGFASLSPFPMHSPPLGGASGQGQGPSLAQNQGMAFFSERSASFPAQSPSHLTQAPPFVNQRPSPFSSGGASLSPPPSLNTIRKVSDPTSSFFPSHTRVSSLSGAASIWTPAPQEVSRSPQLGMPPRVGSMRTNSISGVGSVSPIGRPSLSPSGLPTLAAGPGDPSNAWPSQNSGFGDARPSFGFGDMQRQRTYTTPEMPHWG